MNTPVPASLQPLRIAPSVLAADFGRLAEEVRAVQEAGADWIHLDVMDGHFVPNLTFGPAVVAAVRRATSLPIDVHLMVQQPERFIDAFADAGATTLSVHPEATAHLQRALQAIRARGCRAGAALNPHTGEEVLRYVLADLDLVLVMSVNPGFGGQRFLPAVLPKIAALRRTIDEAKLPIDLEVDGGIDAETTARVQEAGADVLVAGTAVFGRPDYRSAIRALRSERGSPT